MTIDERIAELARRKKALFEEFKEVEAQIQSLKDQKVEITLAIIRRDEEIDKTVSFINDKVRFNYSEDVEKDTFMVEGWVVYNGVLFRKEYPVSLSKLGNFRIPSMKKMVIEQIAEAIVDCKR